MLRASFVLRECAIGERVSVRGRLIVCADGRVRIGDRVQFAEGMFGSELICEEDADLAIGDETVLNYGVSIRARARVCIGRRCLIASLVTIRDHDGRRIAPIVIEDDAWIAHGAAIEPGVTVGRGGIVSAGSVVYEDVPPGYLAIGNPATMLPIDAVRGRSPRRG
jgi:maltose O-acetyltransferase